MKRLLFLLPLAVFGLLVVYFAIGLTKDPKLIPSALIDKPAPEFSLPPIAGMDGPGFSTADLKKGDVSIVNVFASWCVPCREEHPLINALAQTGIAPIYGINYKDKPADAKRWLDRLGNNFDAIGADQSGRVSIDWGVYGVPETYVVDGTGRIRYKNVGPLTKDIIKTKLIPIIHKLQKKEPAQ